MYRGVIYFKNGMYYCSDEFPSRKELISDCRSKFQNQLIDRIEIEFQVKPDQWVPGEIFKL